ncbi:predicted protein [Naegleria gruberi]|uniref:Predicted protein n=1 Tax=Naegleria gruberi TaxID=5762 RepID=D2V8R4_NAEGR|nr:uncharacterized protein NAEGRDRAFT_65251 [Naegleria gruberi]EFC46849.1 predicted protein [Naegleria gruberi]|eukprot:XP_002679593.1 predicted protein [Naegleria gruberi strain NEG-M]
MSQQQQNYNDQSKGIQQQQPSYDTGAVQYGAINPNVPTTTNTTTTATTSQPQTYQPVPYYSPIAQQEGTYTANQPFYNAQPVIYTQPVTYQQPTSYQTVTNTSTALLTNYDVKEENDAKLLLIIGLFIGLVWLICYFKFRRSSNPRAQAYARTSGILFFVQFFLSLALGVALSISMSV